MLKRRVSPIATACSRPTIASGATGSRTSAHHYRYLYNVLRFVHEAKGIKDRGST